MAGQMSRAVLLRNGSQMPSSLRIFGLFFGLSLGLAVGPAAAQMQDVAMLRDAVAATPATTAVDAGDGIIRAVVRSVEMAAIGAEVTARITTIPAREGDAFRKGDVLIEFDCRRTQAEHDAAEAAMKELKAAYESQQKLLEYKSAGTISVELALQQLEKAKAELRGFQVRLESCRILAPFDGLVAEKLVQKHEIAQLNQPLIKIVNQNRLELVMMVPSQWLPQIEGQTFQITIDETGEAVGARILQSTGVIDPVSQTARVIAEFVEPARGVLPGMSGSAQLLQIKAQQ